MELAASYPLIKAAHAGLALLSGSLFTARGIAMLLDSTAGMRASIRYSSYTIDTALLATALLLLTALRLNPFTTAWVGTKLCLLIAYITLGSLALKRGRTKFHKTLAFVAALTCFTMIYSIARRHDPLGFLRWTGI